MGRLTAFALTYALTYFGLVTVIVVMFDVAREAGAPFVPVEVAIASRGFVPWLVVVAAGNLMLAAGVKWTVDDLLAET